MVELHRKGDPGRTFESAADLGQPDPVFLRPKALRAVEGDPLAQQYTRNAILRPLGLALQREAVADQSADRLLLFTRHLDRCEVSATQELCQCDRINAVGLASVARLAWDQRRGDDLAVVAILAQRPLQDESRPGSLVAGAHGATDRKTPEELANLVQIAGKADDLGPGIVSLENRGRDGILVHVETDPGGSIGHGWTSAGLSDYASLAALDDG